VNEGGRFLNTGQLSGLFEQIVVKDERCTHMQ
jgi:hypothetical protein